MRIATSTIYAQQTAAIDDQQALYAQTGLQLSTGHQLNDPSDDPSAHRARPFGAQRDRRDGAAVEERAERGLGADDHGQRAEQPHRGDAERAPARDPRLERLAHRAAARGAGQPDRPAVAAGRRDRQHVVRGPLRVRRHDVGRRPRPCSSRAIPSPASASRATSKSRGSWSTTARSSRSRPRSKRRSTTSRPTVRPTCSRR